MEPIQILRFPFRNHKQPSDARSNPYSLSLTTPGQRHTLKAIDHRRWTMTRNGLIRVVLIGLLSSHLGLADDQPKGSSPPSNDTIASVEASQQSRVLLGGISLTGGHNRFSGPAYWGPPYYGYYNSPFLAPSWQPALPIRRSGFLRFLPGSQFSAWPKHGRNQTASGTCDCFCVHQRRICGTGAGFEIHFPRTRVSTISGLRRKAVQVLPAEFMCSAGRRSRSKPT